MAAGAATLRVLAEPGTYERLEQLGARAEQGLRAAADAAGRAVTINRVGPMLTMFFCEGPVHSFADAKAADTAAYAAYWRHMLEAGVYIAPSQFEAAMISLALTDADLEKAADAARGWFTGAGS
jgi:glutamate-1-semialdehyde 2,1-aminomutase